MTAQIEAWSASRLATYEKCPFLAKCKFVDKLPEPKHPKAQRGIDVHKDAAKYLSGQSETLGALEDCAKINDFRAALVELRAAKPIVEQQWAYNSTGVNTSWFGKQAWWRSSLDAGLLYGDNYFDAFDHKTGKPWGDENKDQMRQYAVVVFHRYPMVHTVGTRLWYYDTGKEDKDEFKRADAAAMRDDLFRRAGVMLNDTTFIPRRNSGCDYCHFRKSNGGPCKFS